MIPIFSARRWSSAPAALTGTFPPGGGAVALVFAAMGFNAFVAGYRVAPHCYPRPQQDAAAAVAWVRAHAGETHTHPDKIAIMGFSAGGHCAASLGVWWPRGRPVG